MSAKIRFEIEGNANEILEAFKAFVQQAVKYDIEAYVSQATLPAVKEALRPQCANCGKDLTSKQIKAGGTYCSLSCAGKHTAPKSVRTRKATMLKKAKALGHCLECTKELGTKQEKFCSRACANKYNMRKRQGVTVTKKPKPVTIVAGQGVIKGSVLPA